MPKGFFPPRVALAAVALGMVPVASGGAEIPCRAGFAGPYACRNVDLLAHLPLLEIGGGQGNDIWGWTDPLTGREYALMGRSSGTSFVDVTDPVAPVYLGTLRTATVPSIWRDVKVYRDYAVVVSEAPGHGLQIFDLTRLRDAALGRTAFGADRVYLGFGSAHNVAVNEETGFAYVVGARTIGVPGGDGCAGGLHMVDLQDPLAPTFAGCFADDGYTHDVQCVVYRGPDREHQGAEVCFASNEDTLTIVDVTSKRAPLLLSRRGYSGSGYTHQGWLTEDQRYFLMDDEGDEMRFGHPTRTWVWDVRDLDAPLLTGSHTASTEAIDHNQYVKGSHTYQANYTAGLRILRLADLATATLTEAAFFDIYPADDPAASQAQPAGHHPEPRHPAREEGELLFEGAWSVYPFFASGVVVVSGIGEGLFVLRPRLATARRDGVGGRVAGLATERVACRNQAAGTLGHVELAGEVSWDCGDAGLAAAPGDRVVQTVTGVALGRELSGSVTGVENLHLTCRNHTAARVVSVPVPAGAAWDCAAAGLAVAAGDRISVSVGGDVPDPTASGAAAPSTTPGERQPPAPDGTTSGETLPEPRPHPVRPPVRPDPTGARERPV